jgi:hypothetical protein
MSKARLIFLTVWLCVIVYYVAAALKPKAMGGISWHDGG